MKIFIFHLLFVFTFINTLFGAQENDSIHSLSVINNHHFSFYQLTTEHHPSQIVYICTGSYSYAYHSRSDCSGLNNCKAEIKYTNENYAVNSLGRSPCCKCWSNVKGRCKDDTPGTGSGGGGMEIVALAIIATSVVILSNDIYVHPCMSFYTPKNLDNKMVINSKKGLSYGLTFGFRKKFDHSALEYGLSYLTTNVNYTDSDDNYYFDNEVNRYGWHFNFVQQLFYNRTPDHIKIYLGPSVNYVYDTGYGGILGTEIKLFDRLKFDIRYELTTQTNQLLAGFIFTYQKKYLWQK